MGLLSWGSYYAKHHLKAKTCRKGFFKTNLKLNFFAFLLSSSLLAPMLALGAVELRLGQPTGLSSSRVDEAGNSFSIGRIYRSAPDLKSARADDTLTFYAPDGTAHSATITKAIDTDRGNRLLNAIADGTTIVAVVNADGDFFSSVRVNGDYFQSAIYEGQTVVYDSAAGEIVSNPFLNDQLVPEKLSRSSSEELQVNEVTAAAEIISVGVLVDSGSQNAYDVVALVDYFIEVANQSYQDVGVDIVFETVAIGTNTPYLSQSDMSLSLYDISCGSTSCNPFASDNSSVISWRDTNKADLVVQIVRYGTNDGTCGAAWRPGPNGADDFTTYLKDLTYSVNALELPNGTFCPDIVVAHTMGHNFGLGHDRTTGCGTTYYSYACGYKNVSQGFGSVMSVVPSNQYVFGLSNPNGTIDGYPFGIPIGQSGEAFAAQAVANVMSYHAAIYQNLSPTYYTVTANAGSGGSISPTSVSVLEGSTTNFTVTSNSNYSINSVTGCNGSLSGSTYTTGVITSPCTVTASFFAVAPVSYTVTPNAGMGGSISPSSPQTITSGAVASFTLTPNQDYEIDSVTGTCGGSLNGNTFTTNGITENCTVMANFSAVAPVSYTVTSNAGMGGSISPSGNQTVAAGGTLSFTLTPDSDYQIGTVGGSCSTGVVDGSTYTTGAITGDCSVTANFESISSLLPDAPILSLSDVSASSIALNVAPLGEGGSAIESATATCTLDNFEERQNGAAYTVDRASGAFTASALTAPETLAVTDPQITQALAQRYAESSKALQLTLFDSELGEIRLNMSSYSPFSPTATIFVDEADQGFKALNHRHYFRGAVEGFSGSYAFLSLLPSGDFDISYEVGSSSRQGGMRSGVFSLADPVAATRKIPSTLNLDDAIEPEELIIPADAERDAESDAAPALSTRSVEPRNFILTGGSGWPDVYSIEVPVGQSHVGVMSRGPGSAGVVMAKDATTVSAIDEAAQGICLFGSTVLRSCVLEDPEPGTYYYYVFKFDSDPTEISVGFADEVKSYEGFKAPIVIDMDADLYSSFASNDEAVAYLASLFAYSSEVYEREVNTQLQIGFVQFRTQDISSSLGSIGSYWDTNYPELERALVAHLTLGYSGGVAWKAPHALCGREYGYSISGVDGIAPTLGAPISWDAMVFSHELGHNFNSPHTHEAGGLLGNASDVDQCTSGSLPGVDSLTGGSPGDYNGTVMSYCHLQSGYMSNIATSFGKNHPYGVAADRIPQNMLSTVTNQAAIAPSCIATYIKQREWSRVVDTYGVNGDGTFDVALEDVAPQQTYTCRATVTNASGDSLPSNTVVVQTSAAYTVTASAGPGGSISPSGNQSVTAGSALTFTLTPDSGYRIGTVGGSCSAGVVDGSTYTTGAITDNCLVTANFELIPHTVTASAGPGGSISPSGDQAVVPGGTLSFTLTPDSGYRIGSVGGNCSAGVVDGNTYTTGTITGDCSVVASFNAIPALTSGTIISNLSGAQGSDEYFYIDVPANASSLTVQLAVGPGDPDIYVGTSYPPPTTSSAACYSELSAGNNESCTISSPSAGRYYVRVYGYSAYSGATLTATVVAPPGTPSILSITPGDERLSVAFTPGSR